jgi:hypothetical protein
MLCTGNCHGFHAPLSCNFPNCLICLLCDSEFAANGYGPTDVTWPLVTRCAHDPCLWWRVLAYTLSSPSAHPAATFQWYNCTRRPGVRLIFCYVILQQPFRSVNSAKVTMDVSRCVERNAIHCLFQSSLLPCFSLGEDSGWQEISIRIVLNKDSNVVYQQHRTTVTTPQVHRCIRNGHTLK